ncbi:hypothetical protein [Pedosphaera parvula]|uniref:Transmembrane protein n=1 Tax=Pedosphaera parvula (strain Ellin514) TaxID=320771 RepID=B9XJB5_PEDPL|nr:hypothetical protein [Pedosphaera parvula]EEF60153.1 hypothetical protein Cflav_PD3212 [Pedosphaera parvula Ellin514]
MPIILIISVVASIAVALITLNWFFRDADDSTQSFQEWYEKSFGLFSFLPWWGTKFGLWLGISAFSGIACFIVLSHAWNWVVSHF